MQLKHSLLDFGRSLICTYKLWYCYSLLCPVKNRNATICIAVCCVRIVWLELCAHPISTFKVYIGVLTWKNKLAFRIEDTSNKTWNVSIELIVLRMGLWVVYYTRVSMISTSKGNESALTCSRKINDCSHISDQLINNNVYCSWINENPLMNRIKKIHIYLISIILEMVSFLCHWLKRCSLRGAQKLFRGGRQILLYTGKNPDILLLFNLHEMGGSSLAENEKDRWIRNSMKTNVLKTDHK